MGYRQGPHYLEDDKLYERVEEGCQLCGSHNFVVFAYCESKRHLSFGESYGLHDGDYDSPVEILDDIDLECADCNAIHWTDDDGWLEEPRR